jgi:hypothetical protein
MRFKSLAATAGVLSALCLTTVSSATANVVTYDFSYQFVDGAPGPQLPAGLVTGSFTGTGSIGDI